jgi:predicted DNA-binding mobile mystery protein A
MRTPVKLLALEQFDKQLPQLQRAASSLRERLPREGWVRGIRQSLGMSMRSFSRRIGFKEPASVKELERNERVGTITLQTLRRAANAMDADFVYAIVPRKSLRETIATRARELARQRLAPIAKSMALEEQGLTEKEIERQVDELARELERKPEILWR